MTYAPPDGYSFAPSSHEQIKKRKRKLLDGPLTIAQWCNRIQEWSNQKGFTTNWENFPIKAMLIVTEISEAVEAHRIGNYEDVEEEMADVAIRLFDMCANLGIDLEDKITTKMIKNEGRPFLHGKRY